ncbi:MAG: MaoC/PaaZ C-terminal domain-containing protein [Syntrophales bacterium]
MGKEYHYVEDYTLGERMVSPARTITETDVVNFAGITGDWHPLHTDVVYAEGGPFKERIAHGMLTLTVGMALPFRLGPYSSYLPESFIAFYGMDNVRFTKPMRIGDTIHTEVEILNIIEKDEKRGVLTTQQAIKNQHGEIIATYSIKVLCGRRP